MTNPADILLSLDPSGTCTGYAVFSLAGDLVQAGRLHAKSAVTDPVLRAQAMARDVADLCSEFRPSHGVVEMPAPAAPVLYRKGERVIQRGQANYGLVVGYLLREAELQIGTVQTVRADAWTKGKGKGARAAELALRYRGRYDPAKDKGLNMADAIELGEWWLRSAAVERLLCLRSR